MTEEMRRVLRAMAGGVRLECARFQIPLAAVEGDTYGLEVETFALGGALVSPAVVLDLQSQRLVRWADRHHRALVVTDAGRKAA